MLRATVILIALSARSTTSVDAALRGISMLCRSTMPEKIVVSLPS